MQQDKKRKKGMTQQSVKQSCSVFNTDVSIYYSFISLFLPLHCSAHLFPQIFIFEFLGISASLCKWGRLSFKAPRGTYWLIDVRLTAEKAASIKFLDNLGNKNK